MLPLWLSILLSFLAALVEYVDTVLTASVCRLGDYLLMKKGVKSI